MPSTSALSVANKKRKCLSFETKLQIIDKVERGNKSKADICREYSIASSTLSTFLKDKEKIKAAVTEGTNHHKRQRTSTFADVDEALLTGKKQGCTATWACFG
ncbi:tigger transposable element-derived protein 6 [Elysia marginata]|uniref:Tigger transposable element-derived protein 6 n=1 Tax=Elysia marginata TaxID=1093978 RepID=A0AAV4EED5_9GAST|nr:tigger transposable element-derived protein 6 [Elysia marginata]